MSVCPLPCPQAPQQAQGASITLSPPLPSLGSKYNVRVEDIMVRDIRYVSLNCKYRDLQHVLQSTKMKNLPLVESAGEMRAGGCAGACPGGGSAGMGMEEGLSGTNTAPRCCWQSP